MDKEPITVLGLEKLKSELVQLKNIKRPEIVAAIAEARSHGDLKENAEYHAAKEQQAQMESRVIEINDIIARANVIDVTKIENNGNVIFGATVTVQDLEIKGKKTYKIVGKDEADVSKNLIYFKSPIGKALIGKSIEDMVTVETPKSSASLSTSTLLSLKAHSRIFFRRSTVFMISFHFLSFNHKFFTLFFNIYLNYI